MYSGEYNICDVTLSPHRASRKVSLATVGIPTVTRHPTTEQAVFTVLHAALNESAHIHVFIC